MRTIKFRGQDIDGNWVYGSLVKYSDSISYIASDIIEKPMELVSTNTIGQFTGLLDKNGNEIYEGDIIENLIKNSKTIEYGEIYYENGFAIGFNGLSNHSEVVSNIYKKREENTYNYNNGTYE